MSASVLLVEPSATVRRAVLTTLSGRGLHCQATADPEQALAQSRHEPPDLMLIAQDVPGRGGAALLRRLRAIQNLAGIPAVLMATRSTALDDDLTRELGADVIQKPFPPQALLAVVMHSLDRDGTSTAVDLIAPASESVDGKGLSEEHARARAVMRDALREPLVAAGLTSSTVDGLFEEKLSDLTVATLIDGLLEGRREAEAEAALSARIEDVALGEILQMLQHERQTGVLTVSDGRRRAHICLREGHVDLATARGVTTELRLGRYLVEDGALEARELDELLSRRGGSGHLLGALLVKLGYVTHDDVHAALVRQSSEIIYETLRWPRGVGRFTRFATRPEAEQARLGLPVGAILMEGLRRVDEWRLIEEQLPSFELRLRPSVDAIQALGPDALSADDRRILSLVSDEARVADVVEAAGQSAFDTCKTLFRLVTSGLLRRH